MRPTKYNTRFIARIDDYLATRQDEEYQLVKTDGEKSTTFENKVRVRLPTIEGFAQFIDVNKTTLYEWEKLYPKFSNALEKIREEQRKRLLDNGLSGDYNPVIAKLVLSANHGMAERSELTGPNGQPLYNPSADDVKDFLSDFERKFSKKNVKKPKTKA